MSGGVDSAVSAALLMQAGYQVVGITCLFHNNKASDCAQEDAAATCDFLGIEHKVYDATEVFENQVVQAFVDAYAQGLTPSPCVACNAQCKFPALCCAANQEGCDFIATGHYARIARLNQNSRLVVKTALDVRKDQSYMLALLSQEQLSHLLLPLGGMTKTDVRLIATDLGLPVAERPESQDNCFIEGDYRDFLRQYGVKNSVGDIVDCSGRVLGQHHGLFEYTIGQRKGIGIASEEPYYVIGKNADASQLVVGHAADTFIKSVKTASMNWQAIEGLDDSCDAMVKLRYRSGFAPCTVSPLEKEGVSIVFRNPEKTTAPGQYAVLYQGDTVLGGGMIQEVERA